MNKFLLKIASIMIITTTAQANEVAVIFEETQVPSFMVIESNGVYSVEIVEPLIKSEHPLFAWECNFVTNCNKKLQKQSPLSISSL